MLPIVSKNCHYLLSPYLDTGAFILLNVLLFFLLLFLLRKRSVNSPAVKFGSLLVALGGSLNILERWLTGCVSDYIPLGGLLYFNVFDILIITGLSLIGYRVLKKKFV